MSVIFTLFPAEGLILLWAQVQIEAVEGIWIGRENDRKFIV